MTEVEVEVAVCQLKRHNTEGHTHLCAENFKGWLCEAYPDRYMTLPNPALW